MRGPGRELRAQERVRLGAPQWQQLGCPNTTPYTHTSAQKPSSHVLFLACPGFPVGMWGKATNEADDALTKEKGLPAKGEGVRGASGRHHEGLLS